MGVRERKEWGDTDEAGPATMTSRALKVGMTGVGYRGGMEVDWGCWLQGGTCHNDKPGLKSGDDWGWV